MKHERDFYEETLLYERKDKGRLEDELNCAKKELDELTAELGRFKALVADKDELLAQGGKVPIHAMSQERQEMKLELERLLSGQAQSAQEDTHLTRLQSENERYTLYYTLDCCNLCQNRQNSITMLSTRLNPLTKSSKLLKKPIAGIATIMRSC